MRTNVLGDNIKNALDALGSPDNIDREKIMRAMGNEIENREDDYPSEGLEAYYSMDDVAITDTLIDTSGHEHHATKVGFGPVARYTFDDDDLTDSSGNGHDATPTDITYEDSDYGRQAIFNGTTSVILLPAGAYGIFTLQSAWSMTVRVNLDTLAPAETFVKVFHFANGAAIISLQWDDTNDRWYGAVRDAAGANIKYVYGNVGTIGAGEEHDLVFKCDGDGTITFYEDGEETDTENITGLSDWTATAGYIGGAGGAQNLDGRMDIVQFFDYCLIPESALALHNRPTAPAEVVAGIAGQALALNGFQHATIPSGLPAGDISVSMRIKATKTGMARWLLQQASPADARQLYIDASNNIVFKSERADGTTNAASLILAADWTADEWLHIIAVQDGVTTRIYADAILAREDIHADIYTSFLTTGYLGTWATGNYFDGIMDEVRIFDRVLTVAEVASLFRFPGGMEPGVIMSSWISYLNGAANTIRISEEYQFTQDNELDYSASFSDAMAAATLTFVELPNNTMAIHVQYIFTDSGVNPRVAFKRSVGGTFPFALGSQFADGGINTIEGLEWLPTSGKTIRVTSCVADQVRVFNIVGYKTGG